MGKIIKRHWHKTLLLVLLVSVAGFFGLFGSRYGFKTDVVKADSRTITCNGTSRTLTVGAYTDAAGTTFESGSDLILDQGSGACTFTLNGTVSLASLNVGSGVTLTHSDNTTAQTYTLVLNVTGDVTVSGSIDVSGKGFSPGYGSGAGMNYSAGNMSGAAYGGYGGSGGWSSSYTKAVSYGSALAPAEIGSGGGNGYAATTGGDGGGHVKITATNLTVSGSILANGNSGTISGGYGGSGGSGGSVYLLVSSTVNLTGATLTANGGNGANGTVNNTSADGGAGGGGRIAIVNYASYSAPTTLSVYGGTAYLNAQDGGAGSIYIKENGTNGTLTYDNNSSADSIGSRITDSANYTIDELVLKNGTSLTIPSGVTINSSQSTFNNTGTNTLTLVGIFNLTNTEFTFPSNLTFSASGNASIGTSITSSTIAGTVTFTYGMTQNLSSLSTVRVASGGTLFLSSYTTSNALTIDTLTVEGTLTHTDNTTAQTHIINVVASDVTVSGSINVNARGFAGGATGSHGSGNVNGYGIGYSNGNSGGAAYGGYGGAGGYNGGANGKATAYGDALAPTDLGSGGGGGYNSAGGDGGGTIKITATNLTVTGSIVANGETGKTTGTYGGGGGSGGSIYLVVSSTVDFTGATITANGGNGGDGSGNDTSANAGAGGGGRIAIVNYSSYTAPTTLTAYGGIGPTNASDGGAGSIYIKQTGTNGILTYDNAVSVDGTGSIITASANYTIDELVLKNGAALTLPSGATITSNQTTFNNIGTPNPTFVISGTFNPGNTSFIFPSSFTTTFGSTGVLSTVTSSTLQGTAGWTYGFTHSLSNLTIDSGSTVTLSSFTTSNALSIATIIINGTLTHTDNTTAQTHVINLSATDLTIGASGSISGNAKGYTGSSAGTVGNGTGGGTYAGGAGGASHGGVGGAGTNSSQKAAYGSASLPVTIGSGGGGGSGWGGGDGGGYVKVLVSNLTLAGSISVNGAGGTSNGSYSGGGGSGGGVYLNISGSFSGAGSISADGGDGGGGSASYDGGGGGGGRIAIVPLEGSLSYTGTITVDAGVGPDAAQDGGTGTIYILPNSSFTLDASYTSAAWPGTISGTSTDHDVSVAQVDLKIQRFSDSYYWNGSDWTASETWVTSTGTSTWSYSFSGGNMTDGTYTVTSRATDSDGEVEAVLTSDSFTFSSIASAPPVAGVPAYASQASDGSGYVTITAEVSDPNFDSLKLRVDYSDNGGINWYDPDLVSVSASVGTNPDLDDANVYQIGTVSNISTASSNTLSIVWNTKSASNGNGAIAGRQTDIMVRVLPNDIIGEGDGTYATSTAFTVDNSAPSGPGTASASFSGLNASIFWTAVTEDEFSRYEIWYGTSQSDVEGRTGAAQPYTTSSDPNLSSTSTINVTISSLSLGQIYYFQVFAFDAYGNYSTSTVVSGTVPGTPPTVSTPTLTQQLSDGTGYITFTTQVHDTDTEDLSLRVEFSEDGSAWRKAYIVTSSVNYGTSTIFNVNTNQISVDRLRANNGSLYSDLVAHYDFDTDTSTLADITGNGYNGFWSTGAASLTIGRYDSAGDFGAQYVQVNTPILNDPPFSVCLWAKPDSLSPSSNDYIIANGAHTSAKGFSLYYNTSGWNWVVKNISYSKTQVLSASSGWSFLCGTWDGTDTAGAVKFYINGSENSTTAVGGGSSVSQDLRIGEASDATGYRFEGLIDEISIFNRILSSDDVLELMNAPYPSGSTTTLTIVWDPTSASNEGGALTGEQSDIQVRVRANDSLQNGEYVTSSEFSVDVQAPTGLANLAVTATSTNGTVDLSWSVTSDTNFNRYEIWYGSSSSDVSSRSGSATRWTTSSDSNLSSGATTSSTLTGLPGGTLYYSVFAIDDYGNTATTTQVSATIVRDFVSTQTGNWNVGTTWGGACSSSCTAGTDFPTSTDTVVVTSTHVVTIPASTSASFNSLNIRGTATVKMVGNIGTGTDITIENGATLQQENTSLQTISGTLTVENGGTFTHTAQTDTSSSGGWTTLSNIHFSADTILINSGGAITASQKGFAGSPAATNASDLAAQGYGPAGGYKASGGASHAGTGGASSWSGGAQNTTYCTKTLPATMGSGGSAAQGTSPNGDGGDGGGLIQLYANQITVTGSILSLGGDGTAGSASGSGGGSGGGVFVSTTVISGSGTISVNGGNGYSYGNFNGGGGGAGCVSIIGTEGSLSGFSGSINKTGGVGPGAAGDGGAGTLYIRPDSSITSLTTSSYTNFSWSGTISGTSTDHDDSVSNVHLRIQRGSDSQYWDGSTWTASETWVTSTGNTSWSYDIAAGNFTDGVSYTISSRATDSESEVESVYDTATFSFSTEANTAPTATALSVSQIASSTARGIVYATTTVSDSNLQDTSLYIDYSLDNGVNWTSSTIDVFSISGQTNGYSTSTGQISGIDSSAGEKTVTFIWYAYTDAGAIDISSAQLRVTPNDGTVNGSIQTSASFNLDTNPPSGLGSFTVSSYTSEQVHLTWASTTDTNFDHYEIWYGTNQNDVQNRQNTAIEWDTTDDADLAIAGTASTTITGLTPDTYYFKIFAIDSYYNESTVADINTTNSNTAPTSTISVQPSQTTNGTQTISFTATIQDTDATQTSMIVEHSTDGSSWTSSTILSVTPDFGSVTTSIGQITLIDTDLADNNTVSLAVTLSASVNFPNTSDDTVYIRLTPQDSYANGSSLTSSAFIVDTINPTTPGSFTVSTSTTSTITFTYGSASTEDHFSQYKVYYTQASSGVTINDTEISSSTVSALGSRTFNGETTFTLASLSPNLPYTITIKAFDSYGNVSSLATETTAYTNPTIPISLAVSSLNETTLQLSWNANSNPSGSIYYLAYSDNTFIATTTATSTNVTIETPGQEYTFKVRTQYANSTTTYSDYSATASGSTTINPPNAPTGVTPASVSTSTLTLSWTDTNSYEDNYFVYLDTTEGESDTLVTTTASNVTSTAISGLTPNTTYYFTVVASNTAGTATSTQSSTTTISLSPDAPTDLTVTNIQSTSLTLSWTDNTSGTNAEDNFIVKYGTSTGSYSTTATTTQANTTSSTVTGLTPNTEYFFVVLATNEAGTATSTEFSTTTLDSAPTAPTNLTVSNKSTSTLTLSWDDNANNETSQTVLYDTDNNSFNNSSSQSANTTSTSITGLTPNTQYYFKVRSTNAGGSNDSTVTTTYTTANAPTILSITAVSYDRISLSWNANTNPSGTVYEVTRVNGEDILLATTTETSYTVTGLDVETTYTFKVRAINADGSGYSNYSDPEAEATTSIDPPTAASGLSFSSVASSSLVISWTDNSTGSAEETSFSVKYGTASGTYSNTATTTAANVTSSTVTGLSPSTTYYFVVIASNSSGSTTSTQASTSTVIYAPAAPSGVTILSTTADTLSLSWTDNSSGDTQEADFLIEYGTDGVSFPSSTTVAANETTALLTSLTPNSTYYVRVTARNSAGSATSDSVSSATSIGLPPKPSSLTFSAVSTSSLTITWTDNSSGDYQEASFTVAYTTDGSTYTTATTTAPDTTSASVDSLTPNTTYVFKVTATNASGSGISDTETTTTLPLAPAAASGLSVASTTPSSVTLTWTDNTGSTDNEEYFTIEYGTDGVSFNNSLIAIKDTTSRTVSGLSPSTTYYFRIAANNSAGSSTSDVVSATTNVGAPMVPGSLTAVSVTTSTVSLTWVDNSSGENEEDNFIVKYGTDGVNYGTTATTTGQHVQAATVTGLTPGLRYYFIVEARNTTDAAVSQDVIVTMLPNAPGAPTLESASATSIQLSFAANGNNAEVDYAIYNETTGKYINTVSNEPSLSAGWQTAAQWGSPITVSGLAPNTSHVFKVRARNANGDFSEYSATSSLYTLAATPTRLSASVASATSITVSWNANSNPSGTVYEIYDYTNTTVLTTTTETSYSLTGLGINTGYRFQVRAEHAGSPGTYSDYTSPPSTLLYTLATAPNPAVVSSVSTSSFTILFSDSDTNPSHTKYAIRIGDSQYLQADGSLSASTLYQTETVWNSPSYVGLSPNTQYSITLRAQNGNNIPTAFSDTTSTYTLAEIPTSLATSSVAQTSITLTWNGGSNPGTTVYTLATGLGTTIATTTAETYTYSSLTCNTEYTFKVKASNADGIDTDWSDTLTQTTSACDAEDPGDGGGDDGDNGGNDVGNNEQPSSGAAPPPSVSIPLPISLSVNGQTVNIDTSEQTTTGGDLLVEADIIEAKLKPKTGFKLPIQNQTHTVQLIDIADKTAILEVRSKPVRVALKQKQEAVVDTDEDQIPDLHIYLKDISLFQSKATAVVTNLHKLPISLNNNLSETMSRDILVRLIELPKVSHVALSEDKNFTGVSYVPFERLRGFTLSSGYGKKTVYVKFRTSQGAEAVTAASITLVKGTELDQRTACPLTPQLAYKTANHPAVYYITETCTKRPFSRSDVFFTYFTNWNQVKIIDDKTLQSIPTDTLGFMPWGPLYDPQYGALVKTVTDPKVYLLLGNEKYWITDEKVFNALNYQWNWIEDVDQRLLDAYVIGSEINYTDRHPNYTLIKYQHSPKVYRLEPSSEGAQIKRHISNEAAFISLNFRFDRIVTIPETETYPDGEPLQGTSGSLQMVYTSKLRNSETAKQSQNSSSYQFTKTLQLGDYDPDVIELQTKLKELGYFHHLHITDYFGPVTEEAVKAFQRDRGLDPIGIVGPGTRGVLNDL